MHYFFVLLFVLFLGILITVKMPADSKAADTWNNARTGVHETKEGIPMVLSREEIAKKLKQLAESKPPKDLRVGAMCYKMALPPLRAEYVCPLCGEKTLYAVPEEEKSNYGKGSYKTVEAILKELPGCRRTVKLLKDFHVELLESQFCRKCTPNTDTPQLGLSIKYKNSDKAHAVWDITSNDCNLLYEFFTGKNKHKTFNDSEVPLKDYTGRLHELLGIAQKGKQGK